MSLGPVVLIKEKSQQIELKKNKFRCPDNFVPVSKTLNPLSEYTLPDGSVFYLSDSDDSDDFKH